MQKNHAVMAGTVLSVLTAVPAWADSQLSGKWSGQFNGIQAEIPVQPGPFGNQTGVTQKIQGPRFTENTLTIEFDSGKPGLTAGTWNAGEFKQRFVCAQISDSLWSCVDSGGRASVEVKSGAEIKVCYLDNRQGAQGAGCATMRKAG